MNPDRQAQMHVLEVLLVAVLFTSAMNVAVSVLPTTGNDLSGPQQLEILGQDALSLADSLVPANNSHADRFANSSLKLWLFNPDIGGLGQYLNQSLPKGVAYRVQFGPVAGNQTTALIVGSMAQNEVVVVERLLNYQGQLYRLRLQLWFGLREVSP